ncbi:helix-turn-helix transcriptional regulator [uncultured Microbacterium sp.]|uniref:helix-turn-helix domain-containing protein n=1 Tax=uncultured Microbacterium sp. TaxID=191216 RepID=UPI0025E4BCFE|nr:helix-turn-helix transcriptional regulator [uncultured Microbacterium sp.]
MLNDIPIQRVMPALRFMQSDSGLSRSELAKNAGMSLSAVSRRFTAETPMTLDDLRALASAAGFDVTLSFTPRRAANEVAA